VFVALAFVLLFCSAGALEQVLFRRPVEIQLGAHLYYENLSLSEAEAKLDAMKDAGLSWVRMELSEDIDRLGALLTYAKGLGMNTIVICREFSESKARALAVRFGSKVDYYQLGNEIDHARPPWSTTLPYMEDEILTLLGKVRDAILEYDPDAKFIVTFTLKFAERPTLVQRASPLADVVGLDVYTWEGLATLSASLKLLKVLCGGKPVWITEFGAIENQQAYIQACIRRFRQEKIPVALIFAWNHEWYGVEKWFDAKNMGA